MKQLSEKAVRQIEDLIRESMEAGHAVGMGVSLVLKDGTVPYEGYFGFRDREKGLPVNEDTIFGIASMTKSFTCLSLRQLEEKGLLSLEDPLSKTIPEFTGKNQPGLKLRHLMCHSGGFLPQDRICMMVDRICEEMGFTDGKDGDPVFNDRLMAEGVRRVAGRLDSLTLEHGLIGGPGEVYTYCNDGFGLLSEVVHRASGKPYAQYLKDEIMRPLGMMRSSCEYLEPAADPNATVLYRKKNHPEKADHNFRDRAFVLNGGGNVKSTVADLRKYLCMYLNEGVGLNGTRILSQGEMWKMQSPMIRCAPGVFYGNGLIQENFGDLTVMGHGGVLPGVSSWMHFSPELGAAAVVLCNTWGVSVKPICDALIRACAGMEPVPEKIPERTREWTEETIEEVVGEYRSDEGFPMDIVRGEDGLPAVVRDGKAKKVFLLNDNMLLIPGRFEGEKFVLIRRDGVLVGIRIGQRIISRVR